MICFIKYPLQKLDPLFTQQESSLLKTVINRICEYFGTVTGSSQQLLSVLERIQKDPHATNHLTMLHQVVKLRLKNAGQTLGDKQIAMRVEDLVKKKTKSEAACKWIRTNYNITFLDRHRNAAAITTALGLVSLTAGGLYFYMNRGAVSSALTPPTLALNSSTSSNTQYMVKAIMALSGLILPISYCFLRKSSPLDSGSTTSSLKSLNESSLANHHSPVPERRSLIEQPRSPVQEPRFPIEQPRSPVQEPRFPIEQPRSLVEEPLQESSVPVQPPCFQDESRYVIPGPKNRSLPPGKHEDAYIQQEGEKTIRDRLRYQLERAKEATSKQRQNQILTYSYMGSCLNQASEPFSLMPVELDLDFLAKRTMSGFSSQETTVENYQVGISSFQGYHRCSMEDAHLATMITLEIGKVALKVPCVGVFDGHAGVGMANYLKDNFARMVQETMQIFCAEDGLTDKNIFNALKNTLVRLHEERKKRFEVARASGSREIDESGSTAIVSLIIPRDNGGKELWTINVGDSRAVLSGENWIALSEDAKPDDLYYQKNIENRGGVVLLGGRINGRLATGRAVGNLQFPQPLRGIPVRPKITCIPFPEEQEGPRTLILCCDGVWDVCASKELAEAVHAYRSAKKDTSMQTLARDIVYTAYRRGSKDNITALLVKLEA